RLAVGLHRGVDGVAAGKRGERRGDAVVGTDRVAEAEAGGGGGRCQHRRRRGGGRLGGGGRRHDGVGFFPAAAGEGGDGDGRGQQGLDGMVVAHGAVLFDGGVEVLRPRRAAARGLRRLPRSPAG